MSIRVESIALDSDNARFFDRPGAQGFGSYGVVRWRAIRSSKPILGDFEWIYTLDGGRFHHDFRGSEREVKSLAKRWWAIMLATRLNDNIAKSDDVFARIGHTEIERYAKSVVVEVRSPDIAKFSVDQNFSGVADAVSMFQGVFLLLREASRV